MMAEGTAQVGLVTLRSRHSVDETMRRLLELLLERGVKVFAVIDHSGEAELAGLQMPATKLVIFGSPLGGTPLMKASPTLAIDLPLKLLIRYQETAGGAEVLVSYNSPGFLIDRHGVRSDMSAVLRAVEEIARLITA